MLCPNCKENGKSVKVKTDKENILRCEECYHECNEPILEKEDLDLLKIASRYEDIYKKPFGYAIERAGKSQSKLAMMLMRIYQKWEENPDIDRDNVVNVTIRLLLNFSKNSAQKELVKISEELIGNYHADLIALLDEINNLMDKVIDKIKTVNKIDQIGK